MSLDVYLRTKPCEHCGRSDEGYHANITHNLNKMADAAGIYGIVWHPEENGVTKAADLIDPLEAAIQDMKANPSKYREYDSPNGWGTYKHFVPWLEEYLEACRENPDAKVET